MKTDFLYFSLGGFFSISPGCGRARVTEKKSSIMYNVCNFNLTSSLTVHSTASGEVGDWKNWLTEEQSAELDRRSEKLKGTVFEPKYR